MDLERKLIAIGSSLLMAIGAGAAMVMPKATHVSVDGTCRPAVVAAQAGLRPDRLGHGAGYTFIAQPAAPLFVAAISTETTGPPLAALDRVVLMAEHREAQRVLVSLADGSRCGWVARADLLMRPDATLRSYSYGPTPLPETARLPRFRDGALRILVPPISAGNSPTAHETADLKGLGRPIAPAAGLRAYHVFAHRDLPDGSGALLIGVRTDTTTLTGWVRETDIKIWPTSLVLFEGWAKAPIQAPGGTATKRSMAATSRPSPRKADTFHAPPVFAVLNAKPMTTDAGGNVAASGSIDVLALAAGSSPPQNRVALAGPRDKPPLIAALVLEESRLRRAGSLAGAACSAVAEPNGLRHFVRSASDLFDADVGALDGPTDLIDAFLHLPLALQPAGVPATWADAEEALRASPQNALLRTQQRLCGLATLLKAIADGRDPSLLPPTDAATPPARDWRIDDGSGIPLYAVPLDPSRWDALGALSVAEAGPRSPPRPAGAASR